MEATDGGGFLIDGRTDDESMVYTPGDWGGQGKRISVECHNFVIVADAVPICVCD